MKSGSWKWRWIHLKYGLSRRWEKFLIWFVWKLPRSVVYWSAIRVAAHATTGPYSNQNVPELTAMDALQRWHKPHESKAKTLFVAPMQREARYWAEAWGFAPDEWVWVRDGSRVRGMNNFKDNRPVFVCGSQPINRNTIMSLEQAGFTTFIDAHDLDTSREPRSALDLLGVERIAES